jgi:hypothetical protein
MKDSRSFAFPVRAGFSSGNGRLPLWERRSFGRVVLYEF